VLRIALEQQASHSAKSRSIGYEEETSPTLRAGVVPAAVALENHPTDSRVKIAEDGKVQTLTSRMGTGGNNVPLVMKIRSGCEGGGKGPLTLFEPKAYGICSKESNAMKSDNPHSGIYEAETSRTLDGNGGNPGCNQGGIAVVESYAIQGSMIGRDDKNGPQGDGINEDVSFTLNTVDRHAVYAMTTGSFTQVAEDKAPTVLARDYNAKFAPTFEEELQPTLVAKGPGAIQSGYTVRRLTPTECARLQGFPDWWCDDLGIAEPTMEDIRYWYDVFETHRNIVSSSTKPKSLKQIAKWLRDPHSDAAEYKMWGNGVALPCVVFVLSGIVYCTQSEG
jgi:DNA (cytosine-5)-methyltransferase 1